MNWKGNERARERRFAGAQSEEPVSDRNVPYRDRWLACRSPMIPAVMPAGCCRPTQPPGCRDAAAVDHNVALDWLFGQIERTLGADHLCRPCSATHDVVLRGKTNQRKALPGRSRGVPPIVPALASRARTVYSVNGFFASSFAVRRVVLLPSLQDASCPTGRTLPTAATKAPSSRPESLLRTCPSSLRVEPSAATEAGSADCELGKRLVQLHHRRSTRPNDRFTAPR